MRVNATTGPGEWGIARAVRVVGYKRALLGGRRLSHSGPDHRARQSIIAVSLTTSVTAACRFFRPQMREKKLTSRGSIDW